jgi:chromosome partitioning protein
MPGMNERCSICGRNYELQFRYQMEEREGGFAFFCSQECLGKSLRGDVTDGVTCAACMKRFVVDLVSQVVRVKGTRQYACSERCRTQLLAEAGGARLGTIAASSVPPASEPPSANIPRSATVTPTPSKSATVETVPVGPPVAIRPPPDRMAIAGPRCLAIFNHKGGTGKTTTSVSIAAGLAARGVRVLLVDTDSQGNVGVSLALKAERTLYHVLVMGLRATDAAMKVRPNLDVIVSNETLAAAELYLAGRQNRDRILRDRLGAAAAAYDVVIVDCSPSLSLMNQNALVMADGVLVPVACDFLSLVGVRQVIKTVKNVNTLLHHPVQIYGVLPTFYDARARICRDAVDTMREHFGERCLSPVRATTKIKEAPAQGKTIFEYAPDSNAARDYLRVVDLLIDGTRKAKDEELDADGVDAGEEASCAASA